MTDTDDTRAASYGPARMTYGEDLTQLVAYRLVALGCAFTCDPFPADWWRFTLGTEWLRDFDRIAAECMEEIEA
jgi:hypothetical protein